MGLFAWYGRTQDVSSPGTDAEFVAAGTKEGD